MKELEKKIKRYELNDSASYYNSTFIKKLVSLYKLRDKRIIKGKNCQVHSSATISLTDNALLELGDKIIIEAYVWIQLTKPAPHLTIGSHSSIGRGTVVAIKGKTTIGQHTLIGPFCQINDQNHGFSKSDLIMNQLADVKSVSIGNDCWLGAGVRILPGIIIGDGAVVGTGSVVTKNIPAYEIWAGNPSKYIKRRVE
jgi:maltose O-acetyltransferase